MRLTNGQTGSDVNQEIAEQCTARVNNLKLPTYQLKCTLQNTIMDI